MAAAHIKSLTGGRIMAVARKHPVLPDGHRSCKVTHWRKDVVRGSQAPSLTGWPPLVLRYSPEEG